MSKKHFIALADAIRQRGYETLYFRIASTATGKNCNESELGELMRAIAEALADFCQSQNSQFNRQRWLGYIAGENGPNGGGRK